jgi:excinuclease UvrABC nuclease subunit
MEKAAQDLDFVEAARLRDEMLEIDRMVKEEKV